MAMLQIIGTDFLEMTVGARFKGVHPLPRSHHANSSHPFLPILLHLPAPFLAPHLFPSLHPLALEVGPLKSS